MINGRKQMKMNALSCQSYFFIKFIQSVPTTFLTSEIARRGSVRVKKNMAAYPAPVLTVCQHINGFPSVSAIIFKLQIMAEDLSKKTYRKRIST